MVNTVSGHRDRGSHMESQRERKKVAKAQHGWGNSWFGELILEIWAPEAIDRKRKLVNPRLQNHIVWWVSTLGLHNP